MIVEPKASEPDAGQKLREKNFGKIWGVSHNFFPIIFVRTVCMEMPCQNRFLYSVGLSGSEGNPPEALWGPAGPMTMLVHLKTRKKPQNLKMQKNFIQRVLTQIFFRLLKHPKRLGLGQKSLGKHPLGPNLWAQKHRSL